MDCKKAAYTEEAFALADIKRISAKSIRSKKPIRAYLCTCGFWHLTSQENKLAAEMLVLKNRIKELELLIKQIKSGDSREINKEIQKDAQITMFKSAHSNQTKTLKRLRLDNRELITKNLSLERELTLLKNNLCIK